jgi:hypothetical protein
MKVGRWVTRNMSMGLNQYRLMMKDVHERVDNARFGLRSKYYVKPAADHPWMTRRTQLKMM